MKLIRRLSSHDKQSQPLTSTTANPNAATAALAVFNRTSNPRVSLASAAAGAALKNRPTTPTNVGDVQTKRTLRRNGSVSSNGTAATVESRGNNGRPSGELKRRGSQGSMTERTFRSPSPGRPGSSGSAVSAGGSSRPVSMSAVPAQDAPPVPAIPQNLKQHSKSNSAGSVRIKSQPLRLASETMASSGETAWFGAAAGDPSNVRTSDEPITHVHSSPPSRHQEQQQHVDDRPMSPSSSVNFSYPARLRLGSPPSSPISSRANFDLPPASREMMQSPTHSEPRSVRYTKRPSSDASRQQPSLGSSEQAMVYDPNSRRMVPRLLEVEQAVRNASERSTRSKKKKSVVPRTGTHLSQGTVGRIHGSAVSDVDTASVSSFQGRDPRSPSPSAPPSVISDTGSPPQTRQIQHETPPAPQQTPPESPTAQQLRQDSISPPSQGIRRMPSVVKEESEPESDREAKTPSRLVAPAIDGVPTKEVMAASATAAKDSAQPQAAAQERPPSQQATPQSSGISQKSPPSLKPAPSLRTGRASVQSDRSVSSSPARTARFGAVQQEGLMVRHEPPPRSISPMKSALKPQSPPRGPSPSDESEASGSVTHRSEEQIAPSRKKSVRVSFDDGKTTVVGEPAAASQAHAESPQQPAQTARKPWYSNIGRTKRKDQGASSSIEDDDTVMQPRPALPSFGSVREKKAQAKEPEDRPLVRPVETTTYSPQMPSSPKLAPSAPIAQKNEPQEDSDVQHEALGQSNDHLVGALLAQEQEQREQRSRNEANISKYREPLPPVVTSIEGSGYVSDTSSDAEDISEQTTQEREDTQPTELEEEAPHAESAAMEQVPEQTTKAIEKQPEVRPATPPAPSQPMTKEVVTVSPPQTELIPSISISQSSPAPNKAHSQTRKSSFIVPGGFPSEEESDAATIRDDNDTPTPPARLETFEPVVQPLDAATAIAPQQTLAPPPGKGGRRTPGDESDTETSVYSDAYEDLSDLEEGGFQSLDAVVDSPVATAPPLSVLSTPTPARTEVPDPDETPKAHKVAAIVPLVAASSSTASPPPQVAVQDWETAKAYWRSLTADKRAQLEREVNEDAAVEADVDQAVQKELPKPKKKKSVDRRTTERKVIQERAQKPKNLTAVTEQAPAPAPAPERVTSVSVNPERTYQIQPGTKYEAPAEPQHLRSTMREGRAPAPRSTAASASASAQPERVGLRKSMRSDAASDRRPATAVSQAQPRTVQKERVRSFPPPATTPLALVEANKKTVRNSVDVPTDNRRSSATKSSLMPSALKRRGSSDSESSFRRARGSSFGDSGSGFEFKKTLRGSNNAPEASTVRGTSPGGRFSLRALSPASRQAKTRSPPPVSLGNNATMRSTLRDGGKARSRDGAGGKSRLLGFGKKSSKGHARTESDSKFSSRFGDSSDEDEKPSGGFAGRFRSRFGDDSSDEESVVLAPARPRSGGFGLPKTMRRSNVAAVAAAGNAAQQSRGRNIRDEEDSESLPDSDDEKVEEKTAPARAATGLGSGTLRSTKPTAPSPGIQKSETAQTIGITTTVTGGATPFPAPPPKPASAPGRPANKSRRSSFMSSILRRKKSDPSKIQKEIIDSAARRDTGLERSEQQLKEIRRSGEKERPTSPKLQKRYQGLLAEVGRTGSGSWPLPGPADDGEHGEGLSPDGNVHDEEKILESLRRPATSGNLGTRTMSTTGSSVLAKRPGVQSRRTLSHGGISVASVNTGAGVGQDEGSVAGGEGGEAGGKRKKKFGGLRKFFRIED